MMQLLPCTILAAIVLLCLQADASNSVHHHRGTRSVFCNYNGREVARGTCECTPGVTGERCNQLNTTACGLLTLPPCPANHFCLHKNVDCLYREDCKDKRGWCVPLDEY